MCITGNTLQQCFEMLPVKNSNYQRTESPFFIRLSHMAGRAKFFPPGRRQPAPTRYGLRIKPYNAGKGDSFVYDAACFEIQMSADQFHKWFFYGVPDAG
jgi:hypothetical protein